MPKSTDLPTYLALMLLRAARGWTQKELAQAAGASNNVLSGYETGFRPLSLRRLEELAATMGFGPEEIKVALLGAETLLSTTAPLPNFSPVGPNEAEWRRIQQAAAAAAQQAFEQTRGVLVETVRQAHAQEARRDAGEQWERLRRLPPKDRRALVEAEPALQSWALCERLCAESEKAAADEASRALELAKLALRVAELVPGEEGWRSRIQGYAWAFVGNARRVGSKLPDAEEAFKMSHLLRQAGAVFDSGLLDEARLLDLEASLYCDQRRFREAIALHDQALAISGKHNSAYILLNKAATQEQMGDFEAAITTLESASAQVMLWIFRAQGVHREALVALKLFCEAAEREQATVALARRVAEYLERARNNPHLRFE